MEAGEAPTDLDKQRTLEREIMAQVATIAVPRYMAFFARKGTSRMLLLLVAQSHIG